eukprot:6079893-Pyramimonas_sp.AAC.1
MDWGGGGGGVKRGVFMGADFQSPDHGTWLERAPIPLPSVRAHSFSAVANQQEVEAASSKARRGEKDEWRRRKEGGSRG